MGKKAPSPRGELRRRWRAFMESGSIGRLRSEGRLMALYVLYWADFEKCTAKFSIRGAARSLGVRPMTAQRGVQQLCEAGILGVLEKGDGSAPSVYSLADPTTSGGRSAYEPWAQRPRVVVTPTTSGGRSAYEPWSERLRAVGAAPTSRGRITRFTPGIPINTRGETNQSNEPGSGGEEPPDLAKEKKA